MSKVSITKSKLDNLANAVAAKSGIPVLLSVDEMTDAVLGIGVGEENVLEGVKVNGIELPIIDKKVNIPVVSQNQAGVITPQTINYIWNDIDSIESRLSNKLDNDSLTIGYINSYGVIFIPSNTAYGMDSNGRLQSTGKFYFVVSSQSTGDTDTINRTVSYAVVINDNNFFNINSTTFTRLGLYVGYISNRTLQYTRVANLSDLPTKVSDLTNDSGFITTETDPTVPAWAKTQNKPTYTFSELTSHPTTISGYGITDAKIENGVIILGSNTITPLPSSTKAVDIDGVPTRSYGLSTGGTYYRYGNITNEDGKILISSWEADDSGYKKPDFNGALTVSYSGVFLGHYATAGTSSPTYSISVWPSGVAIHDLMTPTADTDAATKKYVDDLVSGVGSGTVTSVGLSNATNGGLTISGSPITTNGSITVGHTNVLSAAQTTQAVYPIKIDKNGHISAYGTAVTSMPASDVYEWAKAASKPSYTFSEIGSKPTSVSGYGITDAYTKSEVDSKVSAVLKYKGVKATIGDLPSTGNTTGDTWHVTATSGEYAWDGTEWQELGTAISIPANTGSSTIGISIANHSTDSIYGVSSSTTSVYGVSTSTTTASKVTVGSSSTDYGVTAAGSGSASLTFTMDTTDTKKLKISFTHTHTAPTLGSKVPTVSASDVTVPIKNADATTVPIKNAGATTVVTSATHSVTDTGHTHTI